MPPRQAVIARDTRETSIALTFRLDGGGAANVNTGLPFFDHMLEQTVKHGRFDMDLKASGDLQVDAHHAVEDCGIAIGEAIAICLGDKSGVRRFASAYAPLDESLARVVIDLSGRPLLSYHASLTRADVGGMDSDLFREFFHALANNGKITLHIDLLRGVNAHHQAEAMFKAFGLALATAARRDGGDGVPSTKGVL